MSDNLKRNVERNRTKTGEISKKDDAAICQRENTFVEQFSHDLNDNNVAINTTRLIIEDGFRKALNDIKVDIEIIAENIINKK